MNLKELYTEIASKADTDTLKIGAAEVSRVMSIAFQVLCKLDAATALAVISKGLENAAKKDAKEAKPAA